MTRMELLLARRLIERLRVFDHKNNREAAEPWAYNKILSDVERRLADLPRPAGLRHGDAVVVDCGATGRYIYEGEALWVSAMDNSLVISQITSRADPHPIILPSDDALAGASEAYRHLLPGVM